jgi:SAM-dependent methyltransferase
VLQRRHALCPQCSAAERQRVQWVVIHRLAERYSFSEKELLHFAPEPLFAEEFRRLFRRVTTTDLKMPDVDVQADICSLPFADASFDVVFASHVLEHIREDRRAMEEVRRVLRPGGLAIIEVPIVSDRTVEYPSPNPYEYGHVRAPGQDYYSRFEDLFSELEIITSDSIPSEYQPYVYCNWTIFPTEESPLRRPIQGKRHLITMAVYKK